MAAALERLEAERVVREPLDVGDAHDRLARYLGDLIRRSLQAAGGSDRQQVANQVRLANQLIDAARQLSGDAIRPSDAAVDELLLAVLPPPDPLSGSRPPERPATPLSVSALLVNGPDQPRIGRELPAATADGAFGALLDGYGRDGFDRQRLRAYTVGALLRLVAVHAFRPATRPFVPELVREAEVLLSA